MITLSPFIVEWILLQFNLYPLPLMVTPTFITPKEHTVRNWKYPNPGSILTKTSRTNCFKMLIRQ